MERSFRDIVLLSICPAKAKQSVPEKYRRKNTAVSEHTLLSQGCVQLTMYGQVSDLCATLSLQIRKGELFRIRTEFP